MKYHKLHKASFRQSIFFLFLMILGITLPIACSDLRGPDALSSEELEQTLIQIQEPSLTINGVSLNTDKMRDTKTGGLGAIQIITEEYGMFKVAPRKFDGGIQAGRIDGNTLSFRINELSIELISSSEIMSGISSTPIWVSRNGVKTNANMLFPMENALQQMPPPPPMPEGLNELDDYFVVVEEMPKLKGGIAALQAKVEYPELARKAGIEGRVTVQFIVNEQGDVENAQVVRGIGGGADEEALRVVKKAQFEPGIQRGNPVRVQYAVSINFQLEDSEFSAPSSLDNTPPPPPINQNE